ncbi:GNAT family N-acetyltransferase [Embleya scabrispora]|uniref:GNAT family N-acetyltransferase n=1 Tax=Embleya scabrispora TaxID=159449 RepID=UPI0006921ABD|nr:GNAT family protein [Embleya scabrispora]MYS87653.1 GNAT family N-acetyltransferase [Streptomyces sp. SID5474]
MPVVPAEAPWGPMTWPGPSDAELVGSHVRLVAAVPEEHAPGLFHALAAAEVWTHFGAPRPRGVEEAEAGLRLMNDDPLRKLWIVVAADSRLDVPPGSVIGMTSYQEVSVRDARLEIGATAYSPAVWGSAVNPEAKLLLLRHAFETLGCGRVQFRTDVRNERSRRAITGIGAEYEGTLRCYERRLDGTLRDSAMYAVRAARWPDVRQRLRKRLEALSGPVD